MKNRSQTVKFLSLIVSALVVTHCMFTDSFLYFFLFQVFFFFLFIISYFLLTKLKVLGFVSGKFGVVLLVWRGIFVA